MKPSKFHQILENIIRGLRGVISYFDDIVVHEETKEECYQRLQELL